MRQTILLCAAVSGLLVLGSLPCRSAEEDTDPAPPPGTPTREQLRERVKNLSPEEREARIREFREKQAKGGSPLAREQFEQRRKDFEKFREEIKDLPPEQREARLREFREKSGPLNQPQFNVLTPEQRAAKVKEFHTRVEKEISSLENDIRKRKERGESAAEDERRLQRMKVTRSRLEQQTLAGRSSSIGPRPNPKTPEAK
jgi:hypothetical protein